MKKLSIFILTLIITTSCLDFTDQDHYEVDPIFHGHVQKFIKEGHDRGYHFNTSLLSVRIKRMPGLAGHSDQVIGNAHRIQIDTTSVLWHTNPEALIFHEMGHSFLNREHIKDKFNDGAPKSIMSPGAINFYGTIHNPDGTPNMSFPERREYYINELFDRNTSDPDWI